MNEYAAKKIEHYFRGTRKGIILGREAAAVLERYADVECEEE